jgi:hypothetical protein
MLATFSEWYRYLSETAGSGGIHGGDNWSGVSPQNLPLGIADDDDGYLSAGQILLIAHILVRSDEHLKSLGFGRVEQDAMR